MPGVANLSRWGDSLCYGLQVSTPAKRWGALVAARFGLPMFNGGVPGDRLDGTTARQGSNKVTVQNGFTIATTGTTTIPNGGGSSRALSGTANFVDNILYDDLTVTFLTVTGTLKRSDYSSPFTDYKFTPDPGQFPTSPLNVPAGTTMVCVAGETYRASGQIYWVGHNDLRFGGADGVVPGIATLVSYCTSNPLRYLVMGLSNDETSGIGSAYYDQMNGPGGINPQLAQVHGGRFLAVHRYLVDNGLSHAGITPTAADQANIANDVVPVSLRNADKTGHLSDAGAQVVADIVGDKLVALGWFIDAPPPPPPPPVLSYSSAFLPFFASGTANGA